jgi:hypothetical protein
MRETNNKASVRTLRNDDLKQAYALSCHPAPQRDLKAEVETGFAARTVQKVSLQPVNSSAVIV